MNKRLCLIVLALVIFGGSLHAQHSGSSSMPKSEYQPMQSVKGTIQEINLDKNEVIVKLETDQLVRFSLDKKVKVKADKKSPLAGKKKIEVNDLQKDLLIKVSYRQNQPSNAVEVRVLEQATGGTSKS